MKVFTVGGATQDIFIHYTHPESLVIKSARETRSYLLLEKGAKITVETLSYSTGGGATNSALSFTKLGCSVTTLIKVGVGKAGQYIIDHLIDQNIDTQYIKKDFDTGTGLSYIIPSFEGDRTIFVYRGANAHLQLSDLPFDAIKDADVLYITALHGNSAHVLLPLVTFAKKHKLKVALNPGAEQLTSGFQDLEKALAYVDIFILNSDEAKKFLLSLAQQLTPKDLEAKIKIPHNLKTLPDLIKSLVYIENINFNLKDFCKEMFARGPSIVVVTNGEEGVYVAHKKSVYFYPSLPAKIVDTVGAGDAFGSCFAAYVFGGEKIPHSLMYGILNSQSVISYEDATTGLLTRKELEKRIARIDHRKIERFVL